MVTMKEMVLIFIYWVVIPIAPLIVDWMMDEIGMQKNKDADQFTKRVMKRHLELWRACLRISHVTQMPGQSVGGYFRTLSTFLVGGLLAGALKGLTSIVGVGLMWALAIMWWALCLYTAYAIERAACQGVWGNILLNRRIIRRFRKVQAEGADQMGMNATIAHVKDELDRDLKVFFGETVFDMAKLEVQR